MSTVTVFITILVYQTEDFNLMGTPERMKDLVAITQSAVDGGFLCLHSLPLETATSLSEANMALNNSCEHNDLEPYVIGDEPTDTLFCRDCGEDFDHDPSYTPTEA